MIPTDGNLVRLLVRRVTEEPRHLLYVFLNRSGEIESALSRESLYFSACRLAALLQDQDLQGRPVALYYPHGPAFVIAFWAAILAGAVPMPLTRSHRSTLPGAKTGGAGSGIPLPVLEQSGAAAVLTVASRAGRLSIETTVPTIATDCVSAGGVRWQQPDPDADRTAFIQYTSGSTASPRGVRITHANILHNSEAIRRAFGICPDDRGVCWLPLHHDMGLIGHVIQPLYSGITNHFLSPAVFAARPLRWLQVMAQYGGTISGGPDSAFALCNRRIDPADIDALDLTRWRLAYCGAERIRAATLERFARRLQPAGFDLHRLYPCYGLAESSLFVSGRHGLHTAPLADSSGMLQAVSVGACSPDTRLAVVDPAGEAVLPDGTVGEISLSSGSVAAGYHRDPLSTARRFSVAGAGVPPVLRTGDLGFRRDGQLYITGRIDNCFQYHGRNIFAEDIESAVMATEPCGIVRCAAFVLEPEDEEAWPAVVIVLEHDGRVAGDVAAAFLEEVPGIVSRATGVLPDDVRLWPAGAIPVTTSGKTRRQHCRLRYLACESRAIRFGDSAPGQFR